MPQSSPSPPGSTPRPDMAALHLRVLGGFEARVDGQQVLGTGYAKLRALLARLALAGGRPLRRDVLADLLWPGMPAAVARQNLRRALFNLKSSLGRAAGLLNAARDEVAMDTAQMWLDVDQFTNAGDDGLEQLEGRAKLYLGPFLAGLQTDTPGFDDWVAATRESLHCQAVSLVERLAAHFEAGGQHAAAMAWGRQQLELEPWLESGYRRLMRLHARAGEPAAAQAHYQACRAILERELAAVPDEETETLRQAIAAGTLGTLRLPLAGGSSSPVERRQVTVLYGELLAPGWADPEEALEQLRGPRARWTAAIQTLGGYLVHLHGAAVLAYFGYPRASEHAARKAVEAALAAVADCPAGIEMRAGLHTGVVVTGGELGQPDPLGAVSACALQLRQLAGPAQILLSATTREQVLGYFNTERQVGTPWDNAPAGDVFRVLGRTDATHRLAAAGQLTAFAGRAGEMARLSQLWRTVTAGGAAALLLLGDAGIGKSRLVQQWRSQTSGAAARVYEMRCFPEYSQSALHPVLALFDTLSNATPAHTSRANEPGHADRRTEAFSKRLADAPQHQAEAWVVLAQMLSLRTSATAAPAITAAQRAAALDLLIDMLAEPLHRQGQPALLVVEDVHWLDPSSLELLTRWMQRPGPLLTLMTARPEFAAPWPSSLVSTLDLPPLGDEAIAQIALSVQGGVPPGRIEEVVARAEGIALFAEEIARAVAAGQGVSIPATLTDLLAVRLDCVPHARSTAQLAATVGREFDAGLLHAASSAAPSRVDADLRELLAAGLVHDGGGGRWLFSHALLQEAAYLSQTRADRRASHLGIAHALLRLDHQLPAALPEVLARHFSDGGEPILAARYWTRAGERSLSHFGCGEAQQHFEAGLVVLDGLLEDENVARLEFALQTGLGTSLHLSQGYGSAWAQAAFSRAVALAPAVASSAELFKALWGVWQGASSLGGFSRSVEIGRELVSMAEAAQESALRQQAHYALGNSLFYRGELGEARSHLESSIALEAEECPGQPTRDGYGRVTGIDSRIYLSWTLWLQGDARAAVATSEASLLLARQHPSPASLALALVFAAVLRGWRGEFPLAQQLADEGHSLARTHALAVPALAGAMTSGWAAALRAGQDPQVREEAIGKVQSAVNIIRTAMSSIAASFLATLAQAQLAAGRAVAALASASQAVDSMEAQGERYYASAIHRIRAEALVALGQEDAAEAALHLALTEARSQGAAGLALPAGTALAGLWLAQGRATEALALLAPLYAAVAQDESQPWLEPARHLLDVCSAHGLPRA